MTAAPVWQTWLFVSALAFAIATTTLGSPDLRTQVLLLAPLVAVLGVPHGALDLPIAEALWPLDGWGKKARFALVYLFLAVVVMGLWALSPGVALALFLVYSAVHFSGDWATAALLQRWTGGAATVAAPAVFRNQEVADIFGFLVPPDAAILVAGGLAIVGGATLSVFVISLVLRPAFRTRASFEQIGVWVGAACLAPLAYFIVYFCALHSVRHFARAMAFIQDRSRAIYMAGLVTAATILTALAGFLYLQQFGTQMVEGSILRVVFIGLAALTVPHMILMDRFHSVEPQTTA